MTANANFFTLTLLCLFSFEFLFWLTILLFCCGDIHLKMGPLTTSSMSSLSKSSSTMSVNIFNSLNVSHKPVLGGHLRESQKVVALDRCLLNAGIFYDFPFWDSPNLVIRVIHPKNSLVQSCAYTRVRLLYGAREAITM